MWQPRWETLIDLIKKNEAETIAEIGVKCGETTRKVLHTCPKIKLYIAVDIEKQKEIEYLLKNNRQKVVFIQALSKKAAGIITDETIDIAFIDASHDYDSVKEDITLWKPKIKRGGIMAGHDYFKDGNREYSQVTSAVYDTLKGKTINLISDESPNSARCVWWCRL